MLWVYRNKCYNVLYMKHDSFSSSFYTCHVVFACGEELELFYPFFLPLLVVIDSNYSYDKRRNETDGGGVELNQQKRFIWWAKLKLVVPILCVSWGWELEATPPSPPSVPSPMSLNNSVPIYVYPSMPFISTDCLI